MSTRPNWNEYFINITKEVSKRSNCMSTSIGAIIVKDGRILSSGYNGAPRKTQDCYERGHCLRRKMNIPSGHRYELCRSVHAEQNAIINAARAGSSVLGSTMYMYGVKKFNAPEALIDAIPCFICKKMVINAGISKVVGMMKNGTIREFNVEQWVNDWKSGDMTADMDLYDTDYSEAKKDDN